VRNNGEWTEGRYRSFITSTLRGGMRRWPPKWVAYHSLVLVMVVLEKAKSYYSLNVDGKCVTNNALHCSAMSLCSFCVALSHRIST